MALTPQSLQPPRLCTCRSVPLRCASSEDETFLRAILTLVPGDLVGVWVMDDGWRAKIYGQMEGWRDGWRDGGMDEEGERER